MTGELKEKIKSKYPDATILQVGKWDWIYFKEKPGTEIRDEMKQERGHWNNRRKCWQFSNGHRSMNSPEDTESLLKKYGAVEVV